MGGISLILMYAEILLQYTDTLWYAATNLLQYTDILWYVVTLLTILSSMGYTTSGTQTIGMSYVLYFSLLRGFFSATLQTLQYTMFPLIIELLVSPLDSSHVIHPDNCSFVAVVKNA